MYEIFYGEEFVILECMDCGEILKFTNEEFEEMIEDGEFFFEEDLDDDCLECDCCCEDCIYEDDEDEYVDEELDYMLTDIADEIQECLALDDYEGVVQLSVAYANLFELI